MSDSADDPRDVAGPYGFTRREIIALVAVMALAIAVIGYEKWRDSRQTQTPAWVIEDVLVQGRSEHQASLPDSVDHVRPNPGAASRVTRGGTDLIDVNKSDVQTLSRLPGIGAELARRIIAEREANGSFVNLIDLQRVRGIGPRKAAMLTGWITFSPPDTVVDSAAAP